MEQNIEKNSASEEDKSDNSTLKNVEVKIEEEVKLEEHFGVEKVELVNEGNNNLFYGGNVLNFYNYGLPYMGVQGYQGFYYCPMSAFTPVNQMYSFGRMESM